MNKTHPGAGRVGEYLKGKGNSVSYTHLDVYKGQDQNITSIEATEEAEEAWLATLWEAGKGFGRYAAKCTPSYGNSEGARSMEAARNIVHPGNLMNYVAYLEEWRDAGDMPGTVVVSAENA